jgi:hypothetical protein
MQIDEKTARTLLRLTTDEFAPFRAWVSAWLDETKSAVLQTRDVQQIHRLQGRGETLDALLREITASRQYLDRLTRNSGHQ